MTTGGQQFWQPRALAAAQALQKWYNSGTGLWNTTGWWNAGEAMHGLMGYSLAAGARTTTFADIAANTFTQAQKSWPNFIDQYYDDNAIWGLAWVAAYEVTGNHAYLNMAQTIFNHNTQGWKTDTCGGGMIWNNMPTGGYKGADPTENFLNLSAKLYLYNRYPDQLAWSEMVAEWFNNSGMVNAQGLVNDGLTSDCTNNNGVTWTYNQGMILSAYAALYQGTRDPKYLVRAGIIAKATIAHLTNGHGILMEPCEPGNYCNQDAAQFKGLFMRGLSDLYRQDPQPAYHDFILANCRSIWNTSRNSSNQFGLHWYGPFDKADATRQGSALHALNAAVSVYSGTGG